MNITELTTNLKTLCSSIEQELDSFLSLHPEISLQSVQIYQESQEGSPVWKVRISAVTKDETEGVQYVITVPTY